MDTADMGAADASAPAPPLREVALADRYNLMKGRVLLSGTQALVRLLLTQRERDRRAGLNTAGFVSGYRGSPLGGLDMELWNAQATLAAADVRFQPAVNEDLAATAVWGTQQIDLLPGKKVDGVFAMWYGKGPGVDRSGDPLKHGNYFGATRNGGVLVVCGDDHPGKSSTIAHASDAALAAHYIPVLSPATVGEVVDYGLHGYAMSRFTGLWVGLKLVNETAETSSTIDVDADGGTAIVVPAGAPSLDASVRSDRLSAQADEMIVVRERLPRVWRYARANRLDRVVLGVEGRLGIVTAGKAYGDTMSALALLGIDAPRAAALRLAVYKVGLVYPLEPEGVRAFAQGREELLFVEEKYPFVEKQAATILYHEEHRPRLAGKATPDGARLLPSDVQLDPLAVALALAARLEAVDAVDVPLAERIAAVRALAARKPTTGLAARLPYFCSGCPHSSSTKVPDGSIAFAGIGCHVMALWMQRETLKPTQMGGEGANWIGLSPFVDVPHVFQNIGDGTYAHSGLLAVRATVQAGVNITYKVLVNDAVAMTGGQPVEGAIGTWQIVRQLQAEGVARCVVVSDDPERTGQEVRDVPVHPREQLDQVQRELREVPGVTAIVYEQLCATEKRRRRKRDSMAGADRRVFINSDVCEGCGDCSVQSNCLSVRPKETVLGTKREIDQSSCNVDLSCLKGFCPSFVTVEGGTLRRSAAAAFDERLLAPIPPVDRDPSGDYHVLITGIGGTGVVTIGAVLAMAAHLAGRGAANFNMTGLSQKAGAVFSHLRLSPTAVPPVTAQVVPGSADLVLACDMVAATNADALKACAADHTRLVANAEAEVTAEFQLDRDAMLDKARIAEVLKSGVAQHAFVDATSIALALLGDTIGANMFMVGYAYQRGWLPLPLAAIRQAIKLNGTAVSFNQQAFEIGRLAAHAPENLPMTLAPTATGDAQPLDTIIADRTARLTAYQDARWAERYRRIVEDVRACEAAVLPGAEELTKAVAVNLAKLMTYKDEYEVARLYADDGWRKEVDAQLEGKLRVRVHLAPPFLSRTDPATGRPRKHSFGAWVLPLFGALARFRRMRGTLLDPFGYAAERKTERALIEEYVADLREIGQQLTPGNHAIALDRAELPRSIRGFGLVKHAAVAEATVRRTSLMHQFGIAASKSVVTHEQDAPVSA